MIDTKELLNKHKGHKLRKQGDWLYFIQSSETGMIKIGRSKHPQKRLKQLQTGSTYKLRLIASFEGLGWREAEIHRDLKEWRIRQNGEWFHHDCIGSIPEDIYEMIDYGAFDDWWCS
jgi:hypothetical protein